MKSFWKTIFNYWYYYWKYFSR